MKRPRFTLSFDIGTNSVGSMWFDHKDGSITSGTSIFPAGVDESDDKRGDPKNAKRRMTRRTRITLRRRAERKRELRLNLIRCGLLPADEAAFKALLEETDPWALRREGLDKPITPHQFGRVLLHLAQRRGALGLKIADIDEAEDGAGPSDEDGKVKAAIGEMRIKMRNAKARTFGEFIARVRDERVNPLPGPDPRPKAERVGKREYRDAVRNKAGNYEHCADRAMIRHEFDLLWKAQKKHKGETAKLLTDALRLQLDDETGDSVWKHKGLLFGQRRQTWDLGTLGRCVLEPTERCAPHADMHASRYLVVETVNNLRIIERGKSPRPLKEEEREKIKQFLSGPLGTLPPKTIKDRKGKDGKVIKGRTIPERPKQTVSVTDLRELMGWGKATKTTPFRFNIEADEDREINTDWFSRAIVHGAVGTDAWAKMPESLREGINRALLSHNPDDDGDAEKLHAGVMKWAKLSQKQADALVAAWVGRPKPDAKRLSMSRRAVRNLLTVMDRSEPWPEPKDPRSHRWLTQIEARKLLAGDGDFLDVTTGKAMDGHTRRRYATGAKGATAADRHYMGKHVLKNAKGGPIIGPDGHPLAEPPPAPLISNPVVRKAIHEVRRHVIEYMTAFGRKPDEVYIELAREARMGAKDADRALLRNRLRNRIRNDVIDHFRLDARTPTQQRAAVDRVVLCVQQGGVCPLCGNQKVQTRITPKMAADGDGCEVAHIIPRGSGGHNGPGNTVLAHTKCNRDMQRRTPRQFWTDTLKGGFDEGFRWVEGVYGEVSRPKPAEVKKAEGDALWACYFDWRDDKRKIEQFARDVKDIQQMTNRQEAATKYATRQVMAYLADGLFDGKGLPERAMGTGAPEDERRIFATDGLWTSRLRREWRLKFDTHGARAKGLSNDEENQREQKNRADHRHHAVDAVVIGLCTRSVQDAWEQREREADAAGINTADEEKMDTYRRLHPLDPPAPFKTREAFRDAVKAAVFGDEKTPRPICHRPVKRKLIGALHEETLMGPVLDGAGNTTNLFTAKKSVLALDSNHLRMPRPETRDEALERLTAARLASTTVKVTRKEAKVWAESMLKSSGYNPVIVDQPPGKSGIVRDVALRARLRACLEEAGIDPDDFGQNEVKKLFEAGKFRQASGVPIKSMVLLRTMNGPVLIDRKRPDYATGKMIPDVNPASRRAYLGGNNHHVEVRAAKNKQGIDEWTGVVVSAFEAAGRKLEMIRAFRDAGVPKPIVVRGLSAAQRSRLRPTVAAIERTHAIVNRADSDALGGRFVMSLCEGETLHMLHKESKEPGYFVVAKLDKVGNSVGIVLVPHWDARAAGLRKDAEGKPIADSAREQFSATPADLATLGPPGHPHAVKVRVSPLGVVTVLERD